MKKIAIIVAGIAVGLGAIGFLGPRFVNWDAYKGDIADQVRAATGRDLEIVGSIEVSFLPPAATVEGIKLENMSGAAVAHMATVDRARVRLALLPLLMGKVEVASLTLVRPVVELETLAGGRTNWTFEPQAGAKPGAADTPTAPPARRGERFSVGRLAIEDGVIVYRDSRSGALERVDDIDAELTLGSGKGPVTAKGAAAPRGVPMRFDASLGAFGDDKAVPVSITLDFDAGAGRFELKGEASKLDASGSFTGRLQAESGDPLKLSRSLFGGAEGADGLPSALAQRVTLDAVIAASADKLAVTELAVAHGESKANGAIEAKFGKTPRIEAKLAVDRLDLDAMTAPPPASKGKDAEKEKKKAEAPAEKRREGGKQARPAPAKSADEGFSIPTDFTGTLDVTVKELRTNGGDVRDAHVTGTLAGGTLNLSKIAAILPGATAFSASANVTARKGAPAVDGTMNLASDAARDLLKWLKVDVSGFPDDRLKKVNFAGRFAMAGEDIQVREAVLAFDQTRVTGAANVALRKRPAFGANVAIDRIDLDAYLPPKAEKRASAPATLASEQGGQAQPAGEAKPANPLAGLAPLEAFDANIQARVGTLGYQKMTIQGLALDASVAQGVLTIREVSAQNFAGASGRFGGTLSGFSSQPQIKANLDVRATDAARFLKAVGVEAGGAEKLGRLALSGSINTNVKDAALDVALQLAGGTLKVQGPVTGLGGAIRYDVNLAADFPDMGALTRAGGGTSNARLGALRLTGKAQGDQANVNLSQLKGAIGPIPLNSGEVKLGLGGAKPKIMANLATGEVPLDAFSSPQAPKTAAPSRGSGAGGGGSTAAAPQGNQRWSREPIDMAALKSADGEFRITSTVIRSGKITISNATIEASLLDGALDIKNVTGRMFDGAFSLKGKVQASPSAELALALEQFDVNQALRALADLDRATGKATLRATLRGMPKSEFDFVSSLAGNGTLDGTLTVKLKSEEVAGAGLLGILGRSVVGLQGVGGMVDGLFMAFGTGQGTLKGTFQADRGIVRTNDLALTNSQAVTRVTGQTDLPNWTVDGQGAVTTAGAQQPVFTAAAKGPLDQPSMKFGGTGIQGTNPLQQILPGLLGKPQQQQPQQQQPSQQQKKPTLQDLLKGVTKP